VIGRQKTPWTGEHKKSGACRLKNPNRMKRQTGVRQSFLNSAPLFAVSGNYAYVADYEAGLRVIAVYVRVGGRPHSNRRRPL